MTDTKQMKIDLEQKLKEINEEIEKESNNSMVIVNSDGSENYNNKNIDNNIFAKALLLTFFKIIGGFALFSVIFSFAFYIQTLVYKVDLSIDGGYIFAFFTTILIMVLVIIGFILLFGILFFIADLFISIFEKTKQNILSQNKEV